MVIARLNKQDLQSIVCWGVAYKDKCEEVGLKFEADEEATLRKLGKIRDKTWRNKEGLFEENHFPTAVKPIPPTDKGEGI